MIKNLNYFVQYSADDIVIPMTLKKIRGVPTMKGRWRQVHSVCCDPSFVRFQNNSTPLKAYIILDAKGNPASGPILRKHPPKGVYTQQIEYNICCDDNVLIVPPEITTEPEDQEVVEGEEAVFTVVATGTPLNYQWYILIEGEPEALVDNDIFTGSTTDTLTVLTGEDFTEGEFYVVISNSEGTATSETVTLTTTPAP